MKTKKVSLSFFHLLIFFIVLVLIIVGVIAIINSRQGNEEKAEEINYPFDGEGTGQNPYLIENIDDFEKLANIVNSGHTCEGVYFALTNSLDFSSADSFVAIANNNNLLFEGIFDGKENKIENFNMDFSGENVLYGIFGNNAGTIKNLRVTETINVEAEISKDEAFVALICAKNSGTIENCKTEGKISINYNGTNVNISAICAENTGSILNSSSSVEINSNNTKAGICAVNNGGTITNCSNTGNIQETKMVNVNTAGIVAENVGGVITSCNNSGKIIGQKVAGISAYSDGQIISCQNSGVINNLLPNSENTTENENSIFLAGGIAGNLASATMENCRNTGNVAGCQFVGGIVGQNQGTVSQASNDGTISKLEKVTDNAVAIGGVTGENSENGRIINSKNGGIINSTSSLEVYIAGICGIYEENSIIEQCENSGVIYVEANQVIPNEDLTDKCTMCTNIGGGSASIVDNGTAYLGIIYGMYQEKIQE